MNCARAKRNHRLHRGAVDAIAWSVKQNRQALARMLAETLVTTALGNPGIPSKFLGCFRTMTQVGRSRTGSSMDRLRLDARAPTSASPKGGFRASGLRRQISPAKRP